MVHPEPAVPATAPAPVPTGLWLILGGGIATVVGSFMPWVSLGPLSLSGTDGSDGWITVLLGLLTVLTAWLAIRKRQVSGGVRATGVVLGLVLAAIALLKINNVGDLREGDAGFLSPLVRPGAGLWFILLAGIAIAVGSLLKVTSAAPRQEDAIGPPR